MAINATMATSGEILVRPETAMAPFRAQARLAGL
jgi:hypothetical protein